MREIILLIAVIAYMIGGYFVVGKIGDFFDQHYKDDSGKSEEILPKNEENTD